MAAMKTACRDMVLTQIERQRSLNLECWSSDKLRVEAENNLASEVFILGQLREIAAVPHVGRVRLRSDSSYERSSDQVYYSAFVTAEVRCPDGGVMDISYSSELDALAAEIENMDEDDPQVVEEYRRTLRALKSFFSGPVECGELNHTDFWKGRNDFSVSRAEFERRLDGDDLDVVGLAHDVFGRQMAPAPADQPPARWSPFELYRIDRRLKAGMPPDAMDEGGLTPLNAAVWQGANSVVRALLPAGADANGMDLSGLTPLATAVLKNRLELIDLLLQEGAHIDGTPFARTALIALNAASGVPLEELLKRGLNLDVVMPDGGNLAQAPERYAHRPEDARLLRSHLTTGAIESAMAGGDGRPSTKKDFTL